MIWNDRIKSMRLAQGYTLKDVAKRLGVTEATAQRYESNAIKSIPYETIVKLANIFSCSPSYLMGWESDAALSLSEVERKLILSYRKAPESRREAVRTLLNVEERGNDEEMASSSAS